jgi:elongation factor Ts
MAEVTATLIKDLRERTGAGMSDCKKALVETDGDMDKAIDFLRAKGLAKAAKKAGREATEGSVASYIHGDGKIGVLLEVNCETDFVSRGEDFKGFCRDVAMQIAAMNPQYVRQDDIGAEQREHEKAVLIAKAKEDPKNEGKKDEILAKIIEGQITKWAKEICLLDQPFVKDPDKTIDAIQQGLIAKIGENIRIRRFVRWELGEGLEKKKGDFAAEVAAAAQG